MSARASVVIAYDNPTGMEVGGRWRVGRRLGAGSFGEIYIGTHKTTKEEVAVKMEHIDDGHRQLMHEGHLYNYFHRSSTEKVVGIAKLHWYGHASMYDAMSIELLGPSLEELFNRCNRRFSLKCVLQLADQMLQRVEFLHSRSFLHRDIKPDNFLMGRGLERATVYIIDFGLAKKYRDHRSHKHIAYKENKNLCGTARYASLNAHCGLEQGRRDDLEALGFVLLYFLRGTLPWQGNRAPTKKRRYEMIREQKALTSVETLCRGQPTEFATYLNYCRQLRFSEIPDYTYLRQLFQGLYRRMRFQDDGAFDWS